ncbi:MAG: hypothetical protein HY959_03785 [Ignavibacteriae bacterium]|nr:hypothetical protein [Ignavibacteriota bacterium]
MKKLFTLRNIFLLIFIVWTGLQIHYVFFGEKFKLFYQPYGKLDTLWGHFGLLSLIVWAPVSIAIWGIYYTLTQKELPELLKEFKGKQIDVIRKKIHYYFAEQLHDDEIKYKEHASRLHAFDTKIATEKLGVLEKMAKVEQMSSDTYVKVLRANAETNLQNAQSETERARASILLEGVKLLKDMPPMWQSYIITSLAGNSKEFDEDLELQRELRDIIKKMKEQELRKSKLDNDNTEWKFERNK